MRTVAAWTGGLVTAVDAEDGLAVLASAYGGLRVLDVSDPAAPRLLGAAPCLAAFDVDLQGRLAAVAEGNAGFALFDLSDPALPRLLVRIEVSGSDATRFTDCGPAGRQPALRQRFPSAAGQLRHQRSAPAAGSAAGRCWTGPARWPWPASGCSPAAGPCSRWPRTGG